MEIKRTSSDRSATLAVRSTVTLQDALACLSCNVIENLVNMTCDEKREGKGLTI